MKHYFRKIATTFSHMLGSPWAFFTAFSLVLIWLVSGPAVGYSDGWQLLINTSTTVLTFLMVFLIQNTQNRDAKMIHIKLDELIRSIKSARNSLADLERMSDEELAELEMQFHTLASRATVGRERKKRRQEGLLKGTEVPHPFNPDHVAPRNHAEHSNHSH